MEEWCETLVRPPSTDTAIHPSIRSWVRPPYVRLMSVHLNFMIYSNYYYYCYSSSQALQETGNFCAHLFRWMACPVLSPSVGRPHYATASLELGHHHMQFVTFKSLVPCNLNPPPLPEICVSRPVVSPCLS